MNYTELPGTLGFHACNMCGALIHDTYQHDKFHEGLDAAVEIIEMLAAAMPGEAHPEVAVHQKARDAYPEVSA